MAPVTLSKIQTITIGSGGSANIEFTNIPQIYTDLKVVFSLRCANAASRSEGFNLRVGNNTIDTGSNYSLRYLQGSGTATAAGNLTSQTSMYFGEVNGQSSTSSVFSNGEIYIPNYTSSNYKSISVNNVQEDNQTGAYQHFIAGLWSNASAINIIRLSGTNNISQYSTATLYGIKSAASGAKATGGNISQIGSYYIHTFNSTGTFTPLENLTVEYLVVGGGGGGGGGYGGAGGAGGYRTGTTTVTPTGYTITVGAGGAGSSGNGTVGGDSTFSSITSNGGGRGSGGNTVGGNGGSGGGGCGSGAGGSSGNIAGGSGNTPSTSPSQGSNGGSGASSGSNPSGGGGGGAGAVGGNGTVGTGGAGGIGVQSSISGAATYYAGGGGGGCYNGTGGTGTLTTGGGSNGVGGTSGNASAATANTGGGGGGASNATGGTGGSGVVIIRYSI